MPPPRSLIPKLAVSLDGDFHEKGGEQVVSVQGPHQFLRIGPVVGYHPTSLKTICRVSTDLHLNNEGSIAIWISPLETLAVAAPMWGFTSRDPHAQEYGLMADIFPVNDPSKSVFGWYWRSVWHPQMIAKFKNGPAAGAHADYEVTPYVPVEHLPLREKQWYECVLTWNKAESRLFLYVNGILCGTTSYPFRADVPRPNLYLGNTAMAFAHLRIHDVELSAEEVEREWRKGDFPVNPEVQKELAALHDIQPKPKADWEPDANWILACDNPLLAENSFRDWIQQGCLEPGYELKELRHTPEGLLVRLPTAFISNPGSIFGVPKFLKAILP